MIILLMGVAGSGKTTVGQMLAERLGWPFHDGDDLHPASNLEKMHRGIPLTDEDRWPWLDAVRALIESCISKGAGAVIACSALKQAYRNRIIVDPRLVKFVYLKGSYDLIAQRLAVRHGHFFDPALLRSQFAALEEPMDAIVESADRQPLEIANDIIRVLGPFKARPLAKVH